MKTVIRKTQPPYEKDPAIQEAAHLLQSGSLVVFPTETVYGIGANALSEQACAAIFTAKNRPADNPLIVHVANISDVYTYTVQVPDYAIKLMNRFSPGPVTYVLKKNELIADIVTAGQDTVCIRIPSHPVANELIRQAGVPVAAPSANTSTRPSATTAIDAYQDLHGKVPLILDSDIALLGIESTILDCTGDAPRILRYGPLTLEEIEAVVPLTSKQTLSTPRTPGSRYKHYAPNVEVVAMLPATVHNPAFIEEYTLAKEMGLCVRVLSYFYIQSISSSDQIVYSGEHEFMNNLFHTFRQAEKQNIDTLYVILFPEHTLGKGINERIEKAATRKL